MAVLPTFAVRWLIPRLPRFRARAPGLLINLRTRLEPFDMEDAGVVVAIHYGDAVWSGAETFPLFDESWFPWQAPTTGGASASTALRTWCERTCYS